MKRGDLVGIVMPLILTAALAAQQSAPSGQPVFLQADALKWTDLDPAGAPGVQIVDLWGDHTKGAFGAYLKLPAGFAAPLHTHTHDMRVIFLSGTYLQAPEGKPEVRLGPGSYMLQPGGNYRHATSCGKDAACVFFVESDGPFDLKIVQDKPLIVVEFDDEAPALKFEKYLKTGSGREFARRHFRQTTLDTHRRTR